MFSPPITVRLELKGLFQPKLLCSMILLWQPWGSPPGPDPAVSGAPHIWARAKSQLDSCGSSRCQRFIPCQPLPVPTLGCPRGLGAG